MIDHNLSPQINIGSVVSNAFGEHSLFGINRNVFQGTDASTVFRSHFGDSLFEKETFYIIAGTDSGLLCQYIKSCGAPKGSHYLFVELPEVLALLEDMNDPEAGISVTDEEHWEQQANDMGILDYAIQERLVLHRSLSVVHGHCDSYSPFLRRIQEKLFVFMESQRVELNSQPFTARQIENLSENQIPAIYLKGTFSGKTAVLLAGGPSLDELLPWVQQHRQNLLVIAVSRISDSLLQANIQPDIIVSVDPYSINLNVSKEMFEFQDGTLLANEYHVSSNLLASWGGKKVYMGKRYPWLTPREPENLPPSVGNTVTNTAFSIAEETGVDQIILGGVDFCFSQEGYTHASGSAEHSLGPRPMYGNQRVTTNSGMMAETTNAFFSSAKTIDSQAQKANTRGCLTINPAADAMRLQHVQHLPLDIIEVEPLDQPARDIISNSLSPNNSDVRGQLYNEELEEVSRILTELRNRKTLSSEALSYNKKLFNKKDQGRRLHNKTKLENIEKKLKEKFTDTVRFVKYFGLHRFIPILRHSEQTKEDIEKNTRLYFQAEMDTADDLIDILQRARNRILCRLEEEKPEPNMRRLLDQWSEDQQPGRAIYWAQQHIDAVEKLPKALQQELRTLQDSFDESVEKLNQLYLKDIEKDVNLDGLNAKARDFFQSQDKEGLLRLLAGLNAHHDAKQANLFIPLVQGFLAELRSESEAAIKFYKDINEGPSNIDALTRLFELHTKAEDLESSINVLKRLSDLSVTYSPMYADLLQATDDIDTAIDVYTEYVLANPEDLNTMMKLGKLYEQCGSAEGVTMTMSYILDKDPDNHTAKAMLASLEQSQVTGE